MVVKIGIIKIGTIAISSMIDLILDERADREDIDVRVISSGSKMGIEQIEYVLPKLKDFEPDLLLFVSPNPQSKNATKARKRLEKTGIPTIVIGDKPGEKAIDSMLEEGFGYILIRADPMIGARREFLDPTEMVLFNSYVLNVLSATGVIKLVTNAIDDVIEQINKNEEVKLPEIIVKAENAVKAAGFENPYARSKAVAAYHIASAVSDLNIRACFKVSDRKKYISMVTAAHEMMEVAAALSQEAREIEKSNDRVFRTPHNRDGSVIHKYYLL